MSLLEYRYDAQGRLGSLVNSPAGDVSTYTAERYAFDSAHASLQVSKTSYLPGGAVRSRDALTWSEGNLAQTDTFDAKNRRIRSVATRFDDLNRPTVITNTRLVPAEWLDKVESQGRTVPAGMDDDPATATERVTYDALDRRAADYSTPDHGDPVDKSAVLNYIYEAEAASATVELTDDPHQSTERWLVEDPSGMTLAELRDGQHAWLLTDHQNSTLATLDRNGNVSASFTYDSYGRVTNSETPQMAQTTHRYTGTRYDSISQTQHNQSRDYNPNLRTWTQTDQYLDPMMDLGLSTDPATSDRTLYAGGNPVNMVDEDGHERGFVNHDNKQVLYRNDTGACRQNCGGSTATQHAGSANVYTGGSTISTSQRGAAETQRKASLRESKKQALRNQRNDCRASESTWWNNGRCRNRALGVTTTGRSNGSDLPGIGVSGTSAQPVMVGGIFGFGATELKPIHPRSSLNQSSVDYWSNQSTGKILESYKNDPMRVTPDGRIMNGNTRYYTLLDRGYDVTRIPRTTYIPAIMEEPAAGRPPTVRPPIIP
jgi:RHS repeat-associated protein